MKIVILSKLPHSYVLNVSEIKEIMMADAVVVEPTCSFYKCRANFPESFAREILEIRDMIRNKNFEEAVEKRANSYVHSFNSLSVPRESFEDWKKANESYLLGLKFDI